MTTTADDSDIFTGCIEVKAIEDPESGDIVKDEITVLVPLECELDEDPLYYYPPSMSTKSGTPDAAKMSDDDDTDSESDSDEEDDDDDFAVDLSPLVITNQHLTQQRQPTTTDPETFSFMEELLQTLDTIFGCSYGTCGVPEKPLPVLKSALRRKSSTDRSSPALNRNVSWTKLEIKEFNMTLGNHPSAVTGPPVMLETTHSRESVVDLETYEKARQPRRTRRQLKLSFEARRGILERDRGFTVEEVKKAWSEALLIRKQRQETRQRTPQQQMFDEVYESACRKANRLFLWQ